MKIKEGTIKKDEQCPCLEGIKTLALKSAPLYWFFDFLPSQLLFQPAYTHNEGFNKIAQLCLTHIDEGMGYSSLDVKDENLQHQ